MSELTQRWRLGRDSHRARAADFRPGDYGVELIEGDREARAFVEAHHYSGSLPAARLRVGLYRRRAWITPELVGVAVYSVGVQPAAPERWAGVPAAHAVDLGRLVLLDDVPYCAETWFLARASAALRATLPEVRAVLSYSDPMPRVTEAGAVVMPGHWGACYQAKGARFVGRTAPRWMHLDRYGRVLADRSLSKILNDERGGDGAERKLVALGAPIRAAHEDRRAWLARALAEGPFRRVRHPGQLVYLFGPGGTAAGLPADACPALPYPKRHQDAA
jgi:hypothetical protein